LTLVGQLPAAAGRRIGLTYPDGTTKADQYDAAGNRLVVTSTSSNSVSGTTTYSYDGVA